MTTDKDETYRLNNIKKTAASQFVRDRVKSGKIKKPTACSKCNSEGKIYGHHDDYDKPIEVRWLCNKCHRQWHKENGEGKNGIDETKKRCYSLRKRSTGE